MMGFAFATRHIAKLKTEDFLRSLSALSNESDRAVAIVAGSLVELALEETLLQFLHSDEDITKDMFRASGPIGSFKAKIDLGFLIGVYGKHAHGELDTFKKIRNAFAHRLDIHDFQDQKIKDLSNNLTLCERYTIESGSEHKANSAKKSIPVKDWDWWISAQGRDKGIAEPRGRYILSALVFMYGFGISDPRRMPRPLF